MDSKAKRLLNMFKEQQHVSDDEMILNTLATGIWKPIWNMSEGVSLSRAVSHIKSSDAFCIITAYRGGLSEKVNRKRNLELVKRFRSMGYGGLQIKGVGQEEVDGKIVQAEEMSFLIPFYIKDHPGNTVDDFMKDVFKLGRDVSKSIDTEPIEGDESQWGFVFGINDKEYSKIYIVETATGNIASRHDKVKISKETLSKFYSEARHRKIVLESFQSNNGVTNGISLEKHLWGIGI